MSLDPWGHIVWREFQDKYKEGCDTPSLMTFLSAFVLGSSRAMSERCSLDIRPTIAITKAHIQMPELEKSIAKGIIHIDNKLVHPGVLRPPTFPPTPIPQLRTPRTVHSSHHIICAHCTRVISSQANVTVTKIAVEHAWWLPGVAKRFGIDEFLLRRCAPPRATVSVLSAHFGNAARSSSRALEVS